MSLHVANMIIPLTFDVNTQNDAMNESRSAPSSYKWGYKVIILLIGVLTPVIEDRCPPCMISILNFRGACVITMPFPPVFLRLKGPGSLICSCVFW